LNLPHLYLAPPLGVIPLEFRQDFWHQSSGLSYGVVCMILRLTVLVQCRLVTDGRTDGQTHDDSIYRTSMVLRGKMLGKLKVVVREGSSEEKQKLQMKGFVKQIGGTTDGRTNTSRHAFMRRTVKSTTR